MHNYRIQELRKSFLEFDIDGMIISNYFNKFYLTGFGSPILRTAGDGGFFVVGKNECVLVTDSLNYEMAKEQVKSARVVLLKEDYHQAMERVMTELSISRLGFEEKYITCSQYNDFVAKLKNIRFIPVRDIVEKMRGVKTPREINLIAKAAKIADSAFSHILTFIKPGKTEMDIALELEFFMKKAGAEGLSFETIVASGKRSSLPHGTPTQKKIKRGDTITLDFGCVCEEYCSDMTRTVFLGEPDPKMIEIYNIVKIAQETALKQLMPGITCKDLDAVARNVIKENGFGEQFTHSLGHSVGLEVHENPQVCSKSSEELLAGMTITIEPGIYIEGYGGVRIEDFVAITPTGFKNLTSSPKDIIIL